MCDMIIWYVVQPAGIVKHMLLCFNFVSGLTDTQNCSGINFVYKTKPETICYEMEQRIKRYFRYVISGAVYQRSKK